MSSDNLTMASDTVGIDEAATLLNLSPDALMRKARGGSVPGAKIGRRWVFVRADLIELIRKQAGERDRAYRSVDVAALRTDPSRRLEKGASKLVREIKSEHRELLRRRQAGQS